MTPEELWTLFQHDDYPTAYDGATANLVQNGGLDWLHIAGLSKVRMRMVDEGMLLLRAAASFRPMAPHIYVNAGAMAEQLGRTEDLEFFTALGLENFPDDRALRRQQANCFLLRQDYPRAVSQYQSLLADDLEDVRTWVNLGNAYRLMAKSDDAMFCFGRAMEVEPGNSVARVSYASVCSEIGRRDEALASLTSMTDDPDARYLTSLLKLGRGEYAEGWDLHRDRWQSVLYRSATVPPKPFENLQDIRGKRVVVLREGGHGDMFMFLRYLPLIADIANTVLFHPLPGEERLLALNLPSNVRLHVAPNPSHLVIPNDYDHTVALMDLPYYFKTTIDNIPARLPYLSVPDITEHRLPATSKPRVGICWSGGRMLGVNERPFDAQRSITIDKLDWLSRFQDRAEFVNLQIDACETQGHDLRFTSALRPEFDWHDTASVVAQCDLVLSVDTAMAHLAAAMGKPTWVLSRFAPCWRWLGNRADSPWYPGVLRVFGQSRYEDWSDTFEQLAADMDTWLSNCDA